MKIEHTNPLWVALAIITPFIAVGVSLQIFTLTLKWGGWGVLLSLLIGFLLFFQLKRKIKLKSNFRSSLKKISIDKKDILISDIEQFQTHQMGGAAFILTLKDQTKIRFSANSHFCNTEPFTRFCGNLEKQLKEQGIPRRKMYYEYKFFYIPFLTLCAALGAVMVLRMIRGEWAWELTPLIIPFLPVVYEIIRRAKSAE